MPHKGSQDRSTPAFLGCTPCLRADEVPPRSMHRPLVRSASAQKPDNSPSHAAAGSGRARMPTAPKPTRTRVTSRHRNLPEAAERRDGRRCFSSIAISRMVPGVQWRSLRLRRARARPALPLTTWIASAASDSLSRSATTDQNRVRASAPPSAERRLLRWALLSYVGVVSTDKCAGGLGRISALQVGEEGNGSFDAVRAAKVRNWP